MRLIIIWTAVSAALFGTPSIAAAQGFGVGARLAWVKANTDSNVDVDAVRFIGGQIRLVSGHYGVEVAMDHHSESFELLNQKISETPIQVSVMLRLGGGAIVSPFLLGGPGWYRRKVELLSNPDGPGVKTTEFGWHAGGGVEVPAGRHFAIHGDYRYTFLDFNKDDDEDRNFITGLLPGHRGSMWTLGATVYF